MELENANVGTAPGGNTAAGAAKKAEGDEIHNLDFILDIPLRVSVELGRTKILVRDLLQLGQGSVVELAKFAGEPLELLVNDKLIARGEVVVVNEKFGLRLTDIISPVERIEQLK
jgi:flagellar motor switch protein FliN/FliY